ncbi:hypothetical protein DPMN_007107 [Dreissena polymorpha]|uniref:Uncharacterized protein n=1 Tax=Dreissena polymorpha TaxID=45954 RepID=A0A9D4RYE8_DREPO|nr:hypothetical protein DPMN_007107 [Dreissena polymorpha]
MAARGAQAEEYIARFLRHVVRSDRRCKKKSELIDPREKKIDWNRIHSVLWERRVSRLLSGYTGMKTPVKRED